jgi:hypothetical protein
LLGALLLLVAEFTTLFEVRTAAGGAVVKSVGTGAHHSYALIPIALFVVFLSFAVQRAGSRPALLAIGLMGVVVLLIALLGDQPDAHASGLVGNASTHFVSASSKPSAGLYMETLGAVVLLITCVCGFLLLGPPPSSRSRKRSGSGSGSQDESGGGSEDRSVSERNARAAHHTGPGAAVGQPSHEEM